MENLLINNTFMGFTGSVNMSDEQSACQEGDSKNFLSILHNIMNAGFLKGDEMGMGNGVVTQQPCIQDIYPLILGLLQNISNANTQNGKDAGVVSSDQSQQQSAGKEDSSTEDNNTIKIDPSGTDAASISVILHLLSSISEALNNQETVKLDITGIVCELAAKNMLMDSDAEEGLTGDKILISIENMTENTKEEGNSYSLSKELTEIVEKGDTLKPLPLQSTGNAAAIPVINNIFLNLEQFVENETKGDGTNPGQFVNNEAQGDGTKKESLPTECFIPGASNKENNTNTYSMLSGSAQKQTLNDVDSDINNNIEILARKIADTIKQGGGYNKESSNTEHQQFGLDNENVNSRRGGFQVLFAQGEKLFDESLMNQKKEVVEPQSKDIKISFKDNDFLSYSKQDHFENALVQETQRHNSVKEASFTSVMTEKIEKIVEQYSAKGASMDMIVRLKINDKDTLLVGLRNEGQRVIVDIKTANGGLINILQTNKDDIMRSLEEKNVYTNIFVDPDGNGSFDKREAKRENQRNPKETAKQKDFVEFLETSVQGGV
ncbi:MAG: hypothetical protein NT178_13360 [Proteobacteria bacterium]|nr:hypothetical protein [Pseudomonadota bacterium]